MTFAFIQSFYINFLIYIMPHHITSPTPMENVASRFIYSLNQIKYKPKIYIINANEQIKLINKSQNYQHFLQSLICFMKKYFILCDVKHILCKITHFRHQSPNIPIVMKYMLSINDIHNFS